MTPPEKKNYSNTPKETEEFFVWEDALEGLGIAPQKRNNLRDALVSYFHNPKIHIDSSEVTEREISRDNFLVISVGEQTYYFDLYRESFVGNTLSEAQEYIQKNLSPEIDMIQNGIPVLQQLMRKNAQSGGVFEWNTFLNEDDIVDFEGPGRFSGMNAKELQMTLRQNIEIFESNGGLLGVSTSERERLTALYRSYMEIVMGIGEEFEDGAGYFYITEGEFDLYIRTSIYSCSSFEEGLNYYIHIQTQIYENKRISKKNKEAHKLLSKKLAQILFERFQGDCEGEENPQKYQSLLEQGIDFAKILTERDTSEGNKIDINNILRNPALAQEICAFILSREHGIFETLEQSTEYSLDFSDPLVGERTPRSIITESREVLSGLGISKIDNFLKDQLGISIITLVGTDEFENTYEALSFQHKREVSTLVRFIEKLKSGELSGKNLEGKSPKQIEVIILGLAEEISSEAQKAVEDTYDKNFDYGTGTTGFQSKYYQMLESLEDIGANPVDIEAFQVFNDIRGNDGGVGLNFSDESLNLWKERTKSVGIIAGTIAIVMVATGGAGFVGLSPLASIAVGASTGTAASFGFLDPRKHDSRGEMLADAGTDFLINTAHAVYMEKLTLALWNGSSFGQKAGLIGGDLGSGVGIEFLREGVLDKIFHSRAIVDQKKESFDEYFRLNYSLRESIGEEIKKRFEQASEYYYAWENGTLNILEEAEFENIDFQKIGENDIELKIAIIAWCERQEERMKI